MPDGDTQDPTGRRADEEAVGDLEAGTGDGSATSHSDEPATNHTDDTTTNHTDDTTTNHTDDTTTNHTDEERGTHPEPGEREFDWRGWTLVAAIAVCFLVIPGVIYLYPRVGTTFGLSFWDTYLALPMVPAVVLAVLAVWATTRP